MLFLPPQLFGLSLLAYSYMLSGGVHTHTSFSAPYVVGSSLLATIVARL